MLKIDDEQEQEKNTLDYSESEEEDDDEDMENIKDLIVSDQEEGGNERQNSTE